MFLVFGLRLLSFLMILPVPKPSFFSPYLGILSVSPFLEKGNSGKLQIQFLHFKNDDTSRVYMCVCVCIQSAFFLTSYIVCKLVA